jgi:proteasome lid subunit RPN8/RPN11
MQLNERSASTSNLRDVGQVISADWPSRAFPSTSTPRGSGFQVVCRRSVLEAIRQHGDETPDLEVCGVMVGNVFHDDAGPFSYVQACIRGEHAESRSTQVTFKADTWIHIHERMEQYSGQRILGWYHTHPDFGIFLSAADLYIHDNFFNLAWQIAYVLDPIRSEDGMFLWRGGTASNEAFLIEEDVSEAPHPIALRGASVSARSQEPSRLDQRLKRLEQRQVRYGFLLAVVAAVALVWPEIRPSVRDWIRRLIAAPTSQDSVSGEPGK